MKYFYNVKQHEDKNYPSQKNITDFVQGSEKAFEQLYHQYAPKVRSFLKSLRLDADTDDVLQETFLSLWRNRQRIQVDKPFDNYIFTVAKNAALKTLKKQLRIEELLLEKSIDRADLTTPDKTLIFNELNAALQIAIEKLPDRPRQIFQLKRREGLSTEQIAEKLNISKSTVDNHMNRALSFIRKELLVPLLTSFILVNLMSYY